MISLVKNSITNFGIEFENVKEELDFVKNFTTVNITKIKEIFKKFKISKPKLNSFNLFGNQSKLIEFAKKAIKFISEEVIGTYVIINEAVDTIGNVT